MPSFDRYYTLEEANRLIPRMQRVFAVIHRVLRGEPVVDSAPEGMESGLARHHSDSSQPSAAIPPSEKERQAAVHALIEEELFRRGIVLQDVWRGLIDFPCRRGGGEEVLLCYELSDGPRIVAFHPLETGYAGRRPIEDLESY